MRDWFFVMGMLLEIKVAGRRPRESYKKARFKFSSHSGNRESSVSHSTAKESFEIVSHKQEASKVSSRQHVTQS